MYADLHIHSHYSDGTYAPEDLPRLARAHQLQALALTDHDTVQGCAAAAQACQTNGLEFLPGVELTAEYDHRELHLLGYGIDPQDRVLLQQLEAFQRTRQQRILHIVGKLNSLGVPLQAEAVLQLAHCESPGRPHVGRALVAGGFCKSVDEAFDRFLKRGGPAWVPKLKMNASDAIALIHSAGGAAVAAHPGLTRADDALEPLAGLGMDGLECFHSKHTPHQCEHYLKLARDLGLLVTGGSDCHGKGHKRPTLGSVKLPWEQFELLRDRCRRRRASSFMEDQLSATPAVLNLP